MDRAQYLVQTDAVLHRQHIFGQQFARLAAYDGDAQHGVLAARRGQHLDEALGLALGNRAVEIVQFIAGDFDRDALLGGLALGQADAGDFGIKKGDGGDHAVIGLELAKRAEQRVDAGIPRLMAGGVGELERPRHVARGEDVGEFGSEEFVGDDGLRSVDPDVLQPEPGQPRPATDRDDQRIERQAHLCPAMFGDQHLAFDPHRLVARVNAHAIIFEHLAGERGDVRILAPEQLMGHFNLRDFRAEPRKGLGKLASDRAAAQHHHMRGGGIHLREGLPHGFAGEIAAALDARDRRHHRLRPAGDHDGARREPLGAAIIAGDLDRPRVDDPRIALHHIDPEAGVALDAIMRLDSPHRVHNPRDHCLERNLRLGRCQAILVSAPYHRRHLGALDQRFGRHAAGVEAIAAHVFRLDQRHLGLHRRGDIGRHQPRRACADHHHVAVEFGGAREPGIDPAALDDTGHQLGEPRHNAEKHERPNQRRRNQAGGRLDPRQLRARIHIGNGAEQHPDLTDPDIGPCANAGETHHQIDDKEREGGDHPQGEQIERPVALQPGVDRLQPLAKARLDAVAQHIAR